LNKRSLSVHDGYAPGGVLPCASGAEYVFHSGGRGEVLRYKGFHYFLELPG